MTRTRTASIAGEIAACAIAVCASAICAVALTGCDRRERDVKRERATAAAENTRYAAGAFSFSKYCALCHAKDATGYAADHAPSLVSATFLESATDDFIARGIREGRPGTAMAPYAKARGGPLDDAEVEAIITFLRGDSPARVRLPPPSVTQADVARGEAVFTASCSPCHGTRTARGNAVHLANPSLLAAASDAFFRHAITRGRPGTPMPAFGGVLTDQQIDDVLALIRSWASPPPPERRAPPEPPLGPLVINPNGKKPEFTLRDNRYVAIDQVKTAIEQGGRIVIIDARASSDWFSMHIPGSISVPYYLFTRLDLLPKDGTWITAYCACPHHASGVVVDELRKRGFPNTAILDEGILEWKKRGYPTVSEPLPEAPEGGAVQPPPPSRLRR